MKFIKESSNISLGLSQIKQEQNLSNSDEENEEINEVEEAAEGFKSDIDTKRNKRKPNNKSINSDNDEISDLDLNKSSPFPRLKPKLKKTPLNPIEILGNQDKKLENLENLPKNRKKDVFSSMIITKDLSEIKEIDQIFHKTNDFQEVRDCEEEKCDIPYELEDLRANKSRYPPLIESLLTKVTIPELTAEIGFSKLFYLLEINKKKVII